MPEAAVLRIYPAFIAEMGRDANRHKLWAGVWSGYLIAAGFAVLAVAAAVFDIVPYGTELATIVAIKLATNTAVMLPLRRRSPRALDLMTINITADVVLLTAAIYYTGGPSSPLFVVYVIEVTVMALLSNMGVTLLVAGGILACFGSMCTLVATGTLERIPPPGLGEFGALEAVVFMAFAVFSIGVPTLFTSRFLKRLRDKEVALQHRSADLIEAGKQRSVFLASVTHELRTPIHGVQGLSDLIVAGVYGPVTDKQKDALAAIKRSSQSLLGLIDDLLALVRADVGRLEVNPGPVDLRELIDQVVASVQWMLGTKKLALVTEVGEAGPADVISDRRLLGHVLVNLVANAAKFTPEGGKVTVRARVEGEHLILEVIDTGIGIPDDKRAAIFDAFRQLDGTDERTYGGVGLGLALVRRLCDLLGGHVRVDSIVGKGSAFTVELPKHLEVVHDEHDEGPTALRPRPGVTASAAATADDLLVH